MAAVDHEIEPLIPNLRRYARALCRDPHLADDLVQDTLERALGRWHLWRRGSDLRAWLFTILHNTFVNGVRTRYARAVEEPEGMDDMAFQAPPQDGRMAARDVTRAVRRLPPDQRQVLLLVVLEGLTYGETAGVLGIPVGTVMSRLSRAREALRRLMENGDSSPLLRRVK